MSSALASYNNPFIVAVAIGLSCGTICSPLITFFISSYTMARLNSFRQSIRAFGFFWVGKTAVVSALAFLSSVLGRAVIDHSEKIASFNLRLVLDVCLILTGIYLLVELLRGMRKTAACGKCSTSCRNAAGPDRVTQFWPLVTMGAAYGLTPCAPMLLLLLITAGLPPVQALGLGFIYGVANSISPLLLFTSLAGFISQKIQRDISGLMQVFQFTVFTSFIIVGTISLAGHL
jgi:hypothetical protein